jgi:hypothetical protein
MSEDYKIDRSGADWWIPMNVSHEMTDLLQKRMDESVEQMARNLNASLYSDRPYDPIYHSRWKQFMDRIAVYRYRISEAWLVLTGKADIG